MAVKAEPFGHLSKPDLRQLSGAFGRFLNRVAITIQGYARKRAPVDTGRLRNSIGIEIDSSIPPIWAKIGTNVNYARPMEYGTGKLSDDPASAHAAHFPPSGALDVWAKRHGIAGGGFVVARAIGRRGGLKPRRYLRGGLADSRGAIAGFVQQLDSDVKAIWQR